ncbi:MAG: family 10 glycosylhydrolase [Clostridium sp.]|uniref:glycoside hydrolase family 10 protein n=1 Tax=Clostridium culturomicium TaxID=1499683 RepID=UPI0006947F4E|nr:family 10 glycosylhydrolase [Clostridium culturomicium]MDU4892682.1 family 10 glycosylhydrolase [Clostridium sp.]MDU7085234.1 family 10 glycosylhydrolase [Clostridium sp.]
MDKIKLATIAIILVIIGWLVWIVKFDNNKGGKLDFSIKDLVSNEEKKHVAIDGEVRGVWLSYIDLAPMLTGKDEAEFTKNIESAFENIKAFGLNTVIVQVRPFSDALYKSQYYPWSFICSGTEGQAIKYDPLKIMVKEAHKRDLRIEAWLNPYRVRTSTSKEVISEQSPATKWMNEGGDYVIQYNGGVYYNPGKEEVRQLIVNGVEEIVQNYNVDGIHFDDYFYPSTEGSIDEITFGNYLLNGGTLSLEDWRRENVNTLVKQVYEAIKKVDSEVLFGISPQGSMNNNYNSQYIDVQKWVQNKGYVDYICPQVYYGFENQSSDFASAVESFSNLVTEPSVDLYIGLAAYKIGSEDKWAGAGAKEWINNSDMLKRQLEAARNFENCSGVFIYRYDSLFNPASPVSGQVNSEIENLKKAF